MINATSSNVMVVDLCKFNLFGFWTIKTFEDFTFLFELLVNINTPLNMPWIPNRLVVIRSQPVSDPEMFWASMIADDNQSNCCWLVLSDGVGVRAYLPPPGF